MPAPDFAALALRPAAGGGTELPVRVSPRARASAVAGLWQTSLKVKVAAPPVEGQANDELCAFLARLFDLPRGNVAVLHGERGKDKIVLVRGIGEAKIRSRLAEGSGTAPR